VYYREREIASRGVKAAWRERRKEEKLRMLITIKASASSNNKIMQQQPQEIESGHLS